MTKPIWLLDVDGVINACGHHPTAWRRDYQRTEAMGYPIVYSPTVIDFIAGLHESGEVEVRWLTTWEDLANVHLSPALGLPKFEVAGRAKDFADSTWFKYPAARQIIKTGVPVIWTDDHLSYFREAWDWAKDQPNVASIAPNKDEGLTPQHLELIREFLDAWA